LITLPEVCGFPGVRHQCLYFICRQSGDKSGSFVLLHFGSQFPDPFRYQIVGIDHPGIFFHKLCKSPF
jgi:hypothetical protein